MIQIAFRVSGQGANRTRVMGSSRGTAELSAYLASVTVTSEAQRKPRRFDYANMKSSEWSRLGVIEFIEIARLVSDCMPEARSWLYVGYIVRYMMLPVAEEDMYVKKQIVKMMCETVYKTFVRYAGERNCTPNWHKFCCHVFEIKERLTSSQSSAGPFESAYGTLVGMNNATIGTSRCILKNAMLMALFSDKDAHKCDRTMYKNVFNKSRYTQDDLIYINNGATKKREVYEVLTQPVCDDSEVMCRKIYTRDFIDHIMKINYGPVGILEKVGWDSAAPGIRVKWRDIPGKVVERQWYTESSPLERRTVYVTLPKEYLFTYR